MPTFAIIVNADYFNIERFVTFTSILVFAYEDFLIFYVIVTSQMLCIHMHTSYLFHFVIYCVIQYENDLRKYGNVVKQSSLTQTLCCT